MLHNSERLQFAACWAHARRTVYEVSRRRTISGEVAGYDPGALRCQCARAGNGYQARTEHRQKYALPLLEVIKKYVDSLTEAEVLPKSDMAGALGYIRKSLGRADSVCQQWSDSIDNNRVEQLMRQVALGRKNWLFVANVESGERVARLMSIVSSCQASQPRRWKYLKDVLDRVLAGETDYSKLLPDVWKREHPEAVRVYREEESRYKSTASN